MHSYPSMKFLLDLREFVQVKMEMLWTYCCCFVVTCKSDVALESLHIFSLLYAEWIIFVQVTECTWDIAPFSVYFTGFSISQGSSCVCQETQLFWSLLYLSRTCLASLVSAFSTCIRGWFQDDCMSLEFVMVILVRHKISSSLFQRPVPKGWHIMRDFHFQEIASISYTRRSGAEAQDQFHWSEKRVWRRISIE